MTVHIVDVGQGDGIVIVSPTGKSIIIDAGDRGRHDAMLAQLDADGITALDLAIISHPHSDHMGGMQRTLEQVPARIFLDPGFDHGSGVYARLLEYLARSKTKVVIARKGRTIDIGGGASIELLAPREPFLMGTRSDANANSVVLRLVYGTTSMLFTGDAETPTEDRLLEEPEGLTANILKVAHHGSAYSTQSRFLAAVHPWLAVISCGVDNRFGHPAPEALGRLERAGVQVLRTDLSGTITLISDGARWAVTTDRAEGSPAGASHVAPSATAAAAAAASAGPSRGGAALATARASKRGDINRASVEQLVKIKGIGPGKAQAILDYREANGPFRSMDELLNVSGIGRKTLARIAERFAVLGSTDDVQ